MAGEAPGAASHAESPAIDEGPGIDEAEFADAYDSVRLKPCKVSRVVVRGLRRTRLGVVRQELDKVMQAGNLEEIKDALVEAYADLMGLGAFDAVELVVDEGGKGPGNCNVLATFKESSLLRVHTGTYVQGTEGSVQASLDLNNPTGNAEQVAFTVEYGMQTANTCTLSVSKPRPWGRAMIADGRLHQLFHNYERWSSFTELFRGGMATFASEDGRHALSYKLGWRHLADPARSASPAVVSQLGDQIISTISYVHKAGNLDDYEFLMPGWGLRTTTDVAGLGPDKNLTRFARQHVVGQIALPAWPGIAALHLTAEAGLLLPWAAHGVSNGTAISDRFFLGGVGSGALRGFAQRGVGPTDARRPLREHADVSDAEDQAEASQRPTFSRDNLGGDLCCTLLAALKFRLPFEGLNAAGLHGQVFVNGGNVLPLAGRSQPMSDVWNEFSGGFRCSMGAGIVWATSIGRLELNVCQVLRRGEFDRVKRGLQFGFSAPL